MNVQRWFFPACLITIFITGQAFAQGSNQQITLEVPVQLNNMHEDAIKLKVNATVYASPVQGETSARSLGSSYADEGIPSDGNLNTTLNIVVTPDEGKDFTDAAIYRVSLTLGFANPTNPDAITYFQPSYESPQNAAKAKEGTTLVYLVEGTID